MYSNRRSFITGTLGALCTGLTRGCDTISTWLGYGMEQPWTGSIVGARAQAAHRLWHPDFPPASASRQTRVAIIGGGISALSAGWWFKRNGFHDFLVIELDNVVGGNARSGQNRRGVYPWGAHYIPLPNQEGEYVREILHDLGVITGFDKKGAPQYDQLYLCHAPEERLHLHGRWQNGLLPYLGITEEDKLQYRRFFNTIEGLRKRKGSDGKPVFSIPVRLSSQDREFLDLDKITFATYLQEHSFTSKPLLWYLDYCCQDDFGALASAVSAWAGLHYFASRRPWNSNHEDTQLLTWPEGNGWVVKKLAELLQNTITTNALAFAVTTDADRASVKYFDLTNEKTITIDADYVLYCAPRFTVPYIIPSLAGKKEQINRDAHYSPWMVANITLREEFDQNQKNLAWDNVIYQGKGLGYVDSSHQLLTTSPKPKVLTYYSALSTDTPEKERAAMATRTYTSWCDEILSDLRGPHPDLRNDIEQLDVWLWGHGMNRPTPDYIWNTSAHAIATEEGRISFAHSDLTGISLFEEAQYHGVERAKRLLKLLQA